MLNKVSMFSPHLLRAQYTPVIHSYYDRPDMIGTTMQISHSHSLCEIMYVNQGTLNITVNNHSVQIGRKQYIWIDGGIHHSDMVFLSSVLSMINIEYQYETIPPACPSLVSLYKSNKDINYMFNNPYPYRVFTDHDNNIYRLMKQIVSLSDSSNKDRDKLCSMLCTQISLLLAHNWSNPVQESKPIKNKYVSEITDYLNKHYDEPITVKQIASKLNIQATYLHKLYRENTGTTILSKLQEIRINHAKVLLSDSNETLLSITNDVGLGSQQYFSKLFKRITGFTPTAYRNKTKAP